MPQIYFAQSIEKKEPVCTTDITSMIANLFPRLMQENQTRLNNDQTDYKPYCAKVGFIT
jgi:hypothetical protein